MGTEATTRTRILDAAERLFFTDGIAVTGVDAVAAEAGVAVVTLYKHLGSKDNLLREVLARRLESWRAHWDAAVERVEDPEGRLLAVLDAVETFRAEAGPAQWCSFLATASERPVPADPAADPVWTLLQEDTRLLSTRLHELAAQAGLADPDGVAEQLAVLYTGVLASLLRGRPADPVGRARQAARAVLRSAR